MAVVGLPGVGAGHQRIGTDQPPCVGTGSQRHQRLIRILVADAIDHLAVDRVLRVALADDREHRAPRAGHQLGPRLNAPVGMGLDAGGMEREQPIRQIVPLARRDAGFRLPVPDQLRRQEVWLGALRVGQHQIGLERLMAAQRPLAALRVEPIHRHLREIDEHIFEILLDRADQKLAAGRRIGLPQRCEQGVIAVQPEAGGERRAMAGAGFVTRDLVLEADERAKLPGGT
ncbi:hypothetical protein D3C72_1231350 [compost metagenome]